MRFQLRVKREETDMPLRVESESNPAGHPSDVLHRTVTSLVFCMLLFFVIDAHWPLTYIFPHHPRKGHRD